MALHRNINAMQQNSQFATRHCFHYLPAYWAPLSNIRVNGVSHEETSTFQFQLHQNLTSRKRVRNSHTCLVWHHILPGCMRPTPVQAEYGSSQISGGIGFKPSQEYTPKTDSRILPHDAVECAPPRLCTWTSKIGLLDEKGNHILSSNIHNLRSVGLAKWVIVYSWVLNIAVMQVL